MIHYLWAELSEKSADLFDPAIKYGGGSDRWQNILIKYSELVARVENLEIIRFIEEIREDVGFIKNHTSDDMRNIQDKKKELIALKKMLSDSLLESISMLENIRKEHIG